MSKPFVIFSLKGETDMSKKDFWKWYWSCVNSRLARRVRHQYKAIKCDCKIDECLGWQVVKKK